MEKEKVKTKIKLDKLGMLPFIVLSVFFHILFIWMCFYSKVNKDFFVQIPFEVSFYSPVENKTYIDIDSTVEKKKTIESIKKEKIKESKNTKDVMLVKKGKKKIYKKEQKVKEEQTKEEQTKEVQTKTSFACAKSYTIRRRFFITQIRMFFYRFFANSRTSASLASDLFSSPTAVITPASSIPVNAR